VETVVKEIGRLKELLPTHADSLAHAISGKQRVDRLVVQLQSLVVSCIRVD
jgi:kynurenine formamidase